MRILLTAAAAALLCIAAGAQTPAQRYIEGASRRAPLSGSVIGVSVKDTASHTLVSVNAALRMVPASNLKLITTGCALHAFGGGFRFTTGLGYTGRIRDGVLEGDLYIIGGGDPTLGGRDSVSVADSQMFRRWKAILENAGIRAVHGRIIGDGRAWEGGMENSSWTYDDIGTYYGTGSDALCFYKNAIDFRVSASAENEPVNVEQTYPETPWMHFGNHSFTGPAGSGNSLYLFTTDLAPYSELRGTFASDRRPKTEHFANKFGALTCAFYFRAFLRSSGIEVSGDYADIDRNGYIRTAGFVATEPAAEPSAIGSWQGPELRRIVRETNVRSDNFYAESLFRLMGETASSVAVYDSCRVAEAEVLQGLGLNPSSIRIVDGSGLSRQNFITPDFFTDFLLAMRRSPAFGDFLNSLPIPGEGTLKGLFQSLPKNRVHMKSGSMEGVICYSGYILDESGRPEKVFSILVNNTLESPARIRAAVEGIISQLL